MPTERDKQEFIMAVMPHAIAALGRQHPWLVRWAIAKSCIETGWNINNALVVNARNVLGIKGQDAAGNPFPGVAYIEMRATTGPEAGSLVKWRRFRTIQDCFACFAVAINTWSSYASWRRDAAGLFENIWANDDAAHTESVLGLTEDVLKALRDLGFADSKGRLIQEG